ncbi:MAG: ATP-binding cassette domain-containing protein [Deltaproteobacteria bacterium]|nr:ATP-binding cassette domain-containing protein [Deltaproteobacteria bacterium]
MGILDLRGIVHVCQGRKILEIPSLSVQRGEIYGVVGPNGSGKTTLLSIMGLILRPTQGEVYFEGHRVVPDKRSLMGFRESVVMVFQSPYLFKTSVARNVSYGLRLRGVPRRRWEARVKEVLELVGLTGFEKRKAGELSGGETQLVALARALILDPKVLLLDEPTANVDPRQVHRFEGIISRINSERATTVVLTTHNLAQAYRLSQRVVSLFEGSLVESTTHNLFSGRIVQTGEGPCFDTGTIRIWIVPGYEPLDARYASIDPENVILSREPFSSSARNQFHGRVAEITELGGKILLKVRSQEDFYVQISEQSLSNMAPTVGSPVYLTFKASSVKLL